MITPDMEAVRPFVEAEIERLIEILDTLEPDPDFEEVDDDEPWLGAPESRFRHGDGSNWHGVSPQANDDREDDGDDLELGCEDEGAQCDDEGAIDSDLEPEHDLEPDHYSLPMPFGPCSPIETMIGPRI